MTPPYAPPHKYNGLYGPGFINMMTPDETCQGVKTVYLPTPDTSNPPIPYIRGEVGR